MRAYELSIGTPFSNRVTSTAMKHTEHCAEFRDKSYPRHDCCLGCSACGWNDYGVCLMQKQHGASLVPSKVLVVRQGKPDFLPCVDETVGILHWTKEGEVTELSTNKRNLLCKQKRPTELSTNKKQSLSLVVVYLSPKS